MSGLIRLLFRKAWRLSGPLRQPLFRQLDEHLAVGVERLSAELAAGQAASAQALAEMNLLTESLVRELVRLQIQLDQLHQHQEQEILLLPWADRRRAA
jgi:hypothetical protein